MRKFVVVLAPAVVGLVACGGGGGDGGAGGGKAGESTYMTAMPPGANGNSAGGVPGGTSPDATVYPAHFNDALALYGDLAYAKSPLTAPDNCTGTDADITVKHNRNPKNAGEHETVSDSACNYFKHEGLEPDSVTTSMDPSAPNPETLTAPNTRHVTITRDDWGVPFIVGEDRAAAEFGFGYAQAEDRLWFFDAIRNVGKGHESLFLGPFKGAYDMDSSYATLAGYDDDELTAMLEGAKAKFNLAQIGGKGMGDQFTEDLDNFVAGFNRYISDLQGPKANKVPPEYTSLKPGGFPPPAWTRQDIVASAILIQAFFAGGGGAEVANTLLLQRLAADSGTTFGPASTVIPTAACQEWRDLRHADDPDAWRTIDQSFPTQSPPAVSETCPQTLPSGAAIWDPASYQAFVPLTHGGAPIGLNDKGKRKHARTMLAKAGGRKTVMAKASAAPGINPLKEAHVALASAGLGVPDTMSNFIGVTAGQTKDGHPITVMGPQTGYFDPQLLWEAAVISGGDHPGPLDLAGRGAVTANLPYIELGRGIDFAWSATSGESDLIDVRVSKMCNIAGSALSGLTSNPPSRADTKNNGTGLAGADGFPDADGYLFDAHDGQGQKCRKFYTRTDSWTATPTGASAASGGSNTPETVNRYVMRTHYGPVLGTATYNGLPVVVSIQRSTFFGELDTAPPFALVTTRLVDSPQSFQKIFNSVTGTFNWLYVDKNNIGYIHSGLYPIRAANVHPELPVWGDGNYEWQVDQCTNVSTHCTLNAAFFNTYGGDGNATPTPAKSFPGRAMPSPQAGDGFLEWPDYMTFANHPKVVNPPSGRIVSWNNSPARNWWAADGNGSWGPMHRADALGMRLKAFQDSGVKLDVGNMVEIMGDAAYTDLRGMEVLPLLLEVMCPDAERPACASLTADQKTIFDLMQAWIADTSSESWIGPTAAGLGALRRDRDNDGAYDQRSAVVFMDAWYPRLIQTVLPQLDVLDTGSPAVSALQNRYDAPRGQGSAYQEGWFEPMKRVLEMALGTSTHPYNVIKCANSSSLPTCRTAVLNALAVALTDLGGIGAKDTWDGSTLGSNPPICSPGMTPVSNNCGGNTGNTAEEYDAVVHSQVSLLPMAKIHWINRPTFQQVIQIKKNRNEE